MEFSLPAWLGGLVGAVVAAAIYVPAIRMIEQRWRAQMGPVTLEKRRVSEDKFSMLRRLILAAAIAVLATVGYWIGKTIGLSHPQL